MPLKSVKGMSLVELMVTLAVVGILSSIAYPNYTKYTRKARRSEAKTTLLKAQSSFEKNYADHGTYVNAPPSLNIASTGYYSYSTSAVTQSTYTITAQAMSGQIEDKANDGTSCQTLSLTHTGDMTPVQCWN